MTMSQRWWNPTLWLSLLFLSIQPPCSQPVSQPPALHSYPRLSAEGPPLTAMQAPCSSGRGLCQARGASFLFPRRTQLRARCWRRHDLRVRAAAAKVEEELSDEKKDIQKLLSKPYKYGFKTIIESEVFPKGLSEDVVRAISAKKNEPEWLLDFRCAGGLNAALWMGRVRSSRGDTSGRLLPAAAASWRPEAADVAPPAPLLLSPPLLRRCRLKAYRKWLTMEEPKWSDNLYPPINYQDVSYYSAPKAVEKKQSLDEVRRPGSGGGRRGQGRGQGTRGRGARSLGLFVKELVAGLGQSKGRVLYPPQPGHLP